MSFWFTPAIMAFVAIALARLMYAVDTLVADEGLAASPFVLSGSVGDLRSALLTMAATVLATTGIVFTLMTLPLSTVAAQYGSRLLRVFVGDRTIQVVLGMFVATFVYCVVGVLAIPAVDIPVETPQLTATVGLYLMLATFAGLIVLIQHISTMLQAPNVAAAAARQFDSVVRTYTSHERHEHGVGAADGRAVDTSALLPEERGRALRAQSTGYVQSIDPEALLALATSKDVTFKILRGAGQFVREDSVVAVGWPDHGVDRNVERLFHRAYQVGRGRTPTQDVEFSIQQLAEMAVRAMSPAINDPYTAMTCIDYLRKGLSEFVGQGAPRTVYRDQVRRVRVVVALPTFEQLVRAAFDMLRHASCDNATVLLHMVAALGRIGEHARTLEERRVLAEQADMIAAECDAGRLIEPDRRRVRTRAAELSARLGVPPT